MCDHPNREAAMVVVRRDHNGTPTVWCDPCLVPLIEALNAGGIETAASCCGHNGKGSDGLQVDAPGWVMLWDGRTLFVADSPDLLARARAEGAAEALREAAANAWCDIDRRRLLAMAARSDAAPHTTGGQA